MSDDVECRDLCSTCKHGPDCTFPRDPQRPAFYCEEFEIETVPKRGANEGGQQQSRGSHLVDAGPSARLAGLCSDCENRRTCVFPKPEGGVWHCEEYQ
jgi:hypothetical protein